MYELPLSECKMSLFARVLDRLRLLPWSGVFEHPKRLRRFLIRIALISTGIVNREVGITTWLIAKKVYQLSKASGYLFTALYLKQCSTSLMKYYAGESPDLLNNMPSVMVKLSNAGIPAIIPVHHRHIIMCRNDRSDFLVRYYLSLFSLCRIVKLAKPVSRSTFSTIVQGPLDIGKVREMLGRCKSEFPLLQKRYLPWVSTIPLHKGLRWMPTWKSVPNDDRMFRKVHSPMETTRRKGKDGKYQLVERPMVLHKNIFTSTKFEIAAFAQLLNLVHSFEGIWSPALLFRKATLFALDNTTTTQLCNEDLDHYERTLGPVFSQVGSAFDGHPLHMGRLVDSLEGAGKRRLFVIGNYVKQRLLYPVHQWAMKVLSSIPTDGTYHQLAPIDKLVSRSHHWVRSIDLSAATDRWPVSIIHDLMSCMFGPTFASSVVNGGLAMNVCTVQPPLVKKRQQLCFQTGQPLGYYGSWALFALSHHYIVWLSADKVLPGVLFTDYALLGDDIVICHPGVAAEYQRNLDNLGVSISVAKSIVSDKGFLEFAKKFICLDPYKDLSPVSAKAVLAAHTLIGVAALGHQYSVPFKALVRFAGGGFRVLSSLQSGKLSKRYRRLKAIGTMPSRHKKGSDEPLEYWIGRGFPLSPYLMGIIHQMVLDTFHPKKWQDVPMQQYWWEKERDNLEYTVLRNWVQCTLEYERWYYNLFLSPPCSLEYYLTPPVVSYTYRRTEYDMKVLFDSYGLTFQIYDLAEGKTPGWMPGVLGPGRDQSQTGFSIIMPSGIRKVYFHPGSNLLVDASRPKPN